MKALAVNIDGQRLFVSKVCPKTIKFCGPHDANKACMTDFDIDATMKLISKVYGHTEFFPIDYDEVRLKFEQHYRPVCKFKAGSAFAAKHGIHDWHHIKFFGNLMVSVVWDTRIVEHVFVLNDLDDSIYDDLYYIWDDASKIRLSLFNGTEAWHNDIKAELHMQSLIKPANLAKLDNNSCYPSGAKITK